MLIEVSPTLNYQEFTSILLPLKLTLKRNWGYFRLVPHNDEDNRY